MGTEYHDHYTPPLNPCSLETLGLPIVNKERKFWPLITSCYHLQEDGSRKGHMDFFAVDAVPSQQQPVQFGKPIPIEMSSSGGILDGKWYPKSSDQRRQDTKNWLFATAKSTGQVAIHEFRLNEDTDHADSELPPLLAEEVCINDPLECPTGGASPLCLAVNWDTSSSDTSDVEMTTSASLTASYSNGMVAIHDVTKCPETGRYTITERDSWLAHTLFGSTPAEVWSTCFAANGKIVMSGGDDAKLKFWDVRCSSTARRRPAMQVLADDFQAGVTVLSPHPRKEHLVAVGSYDETVGLYDVRYTAIPTARSKKSEELGGGIWRLQWHPYHDEKLLVAAMHGGCRVLDLGSSNIDDDAPTFTVSKEFTEHKSMAYGADWLVTEAVGEEPGIQAAASCSFYDKAAYLWDTKS